VLNTVCSNGPGGNPGRSRCSSFGCGKETVGIIPYLLASPPVRQQADKLEDKEVQLRLAFDALPDENEETVVVRMDNVAWVSIQYEEFIRNAMANLSGTNRTSLQKRSLPFCRPTRLPTISFKVFTSCSIGTMAKPRTI
jgi:hypothetical protein